MLATLSAVTFVQYASAGTLTVVEGCGTLQENVAQFGFLNVHTTCVRSVSECFFVSSSHTLVSSSAPPASSMHVVGLSSKPVLRHVLAQRTYFPAWGIQSFATELMDDFAT